MGVAQWAMLGSMFVATGCGANVAAVPNCPTPTAGQASNAGELYYSNPYTFANAATCFTATFPAPPSVTRADKAATLGTVVSTTFAAGSPGVFAFVNIVHLPWMMSTLGSDNKITESIRDQFLTTIKGKASSTEDTKVQGYDALLMHYERVSGDRGSAYVVVVGSWVYLVVGQSSQPESTEPAAFLKSFKLDQACIEKL